MKRITTWFLIADGSRAKIAYNDGPGRGIKAIAGAEFQGRNLAARDILSDRPGRTFDSVGGGRHAKVPTSDPRELEKRDIVRRLAKHLDEAAHRDDFDRLVLIAPPKVLGHLRALLSTKVRDKVTTEIHKDLTQIPLREVEDHLGELPI